VTIVGGGISGLAAAFYLARDARDLDLRILEGESRLGGTMGSDAIDGFIFERGPNGFLDNVPHTLDLARGLGLEGRVIRADPAAKNRYIFKRGRLHALPRSPLGIFTSPLLSLKSRLRLPLEVFHPRTSPSEEDSVASFGRRHFGEEFVRTLLDPMVSGIHAADVERLSLESAFPKIARLEREHGSLIRAFIRLRKQPREPAPGEAPAGGAAPPLAAADPPPRRGGPMGPGGTLCAFPGGLEELVAALSAFLGDRIRLKWKAASLRKQGQRFVVESASGERETADAVILALPSYRAASLLSSCAPGVARALEAIPYAPIAVVCLGVDRGAVEHPLDGFGFLAPRDQGLRLLGAIWVSSIYPQHAAEGKVNLRCMIGGARDPDAVNLSDGHLLDLILEELRPILGLRGQPAATRVYRYSRGIPQYNVGHAGRIDRIERELWDLPGIFITGNAYYGVGINDCVREGQRKARAVREYLGVR
jgi:oxygen-dependent protoporphyrinogen oxidase